MQDLIKHKQFEIEVLDKLKSGKFLENMIFTGGTMLRPCYELNRFSVDLHFWLYKAIDTEKYFKNIKEYLSDFYTIRDSEDKFYTMLFEIKGKDYPRMLKIKIRKKVERLKTDMSIAYSKFSNTQLLVRTLSLEEVMKSKIEAFLKKKK